LNEKELEQRCREAYQRGVLKEMEKDIRRRTLKKAEVITRSMRPEEKEEYLRSGAFQNALKQTRKKDRVYQAVERGELPEGYEAEFRRLRPLIETEVKEGRAVDPEFLKSVLRIRRPLREARQAVRLVREKQPAAWLRRNAGRIAGDLDHELTVYLTRGDLSHLIKREEIHGSVAESLMRSEFRRGIPPRILEDVLGLEREMEDRLWQAFPALRNCRQLRVGKERTAEERDPGKSSAPTGAHPARTG